MKQTLLLLLGLMALLCQPLKAKDNIKLFAKAVSEENGKIIVDDATVVSVYVYSNYPIGEVNISDKPVKMSGCDVRSVSTGRRLRQSMTRVDGKPYYTVLGAQYLVSGQTLGRTTFPQLDINVTLLQEEKQTRDRESDSFFDLFDPFFRRPSYKKIKKAVRSDLLKMEVVKAPRKSAEQLKSEGKVVI
jgi:hypothetical protein